MNPTTLEAFLNELSNIDKTASVSMTLKRGLVRLRQGAKAVSNTAGAAERGALTAAAKVIPPDKLHKAALKSTEILHKLYA
jgi:hypothetical protein